MARHLPNGGMNVTTFGTGYVGLVSSACLADMGNRVLCFDVDATRIRHLLAGRMPIHEPGLAELVERHVRARRLAFTTSARACAQLQLCQMPRS